jgi:hypothetical protein
MAWMEKEAITISDFCMEELRKCCLNRGYQQCKAQQVTILIDTFFSLSSRAN